MEEEIVIEEVVEVEDEGDDEGVFRVELDSVLVGKAVELVVFQEENSAIGTGGEYKRHVVYARLFKDPELDYTKKDLAMAIELAVREADV